MKTPHQLQTQERKERSAENQEQRPELLSELEEVITINMCDRKITAKGGQFELREGDRRTVALVKEYCRRYGWDCTYSAQEDSSWSMTAKSEMYFTRHVYYLTPKK